MSDEREYITALTVQADGSIAFEFDTLGKSAVREEIVRCRDCKRVTIDQGDHDYREPLWCGLFHIDVSLDGFCAWGERKEA